MSEYSSDERSRLGWLLILLVLLLSFGCIFVAAHLSTLETADRAVQAAMLSRLDSNYQAETRVIFAPLDPAVVGYATRDEILLARTPVWEATAETPVAVVELPTLHPTGPSGPEDLPQGKETVTSLPDTPLPRDPSATPSPTLTPTDTPRAQPPTATRRPSETPTSSATPTPSPTPTKTSTPTPTATWTPTPTFTPSNTPPPPPTWTHTPTHTPTSTPTATDTPTPSATPTPSMTPTYTPSPTPIPPRGAVQPIFECVQDLGGGQYRAFFGYQNNNSFAVTLPSGPENFVLPPPFDGGQPTTFQPGRANSAYSVVFATDYVTWVLDYSGATALPTSPRCN